MKRSFVLVIVVLLIFLVACNKTIHNSAQCSLSGEKEGLYGTVYQKQWEPTSDYEFRILVKLGDSSLCEFAATENQFTTLEPGEQVYVKFDK